MNVFEGSPLVTATELKNLLGRENIKIFDVRGRWGTPPVSDYDEYLTGHIPGAAFLDWTTQFLDPGLPIGLAPVASKAEAQQAFHDLGINQHDCVVLYDDYHHMLAGRVWWAMRYWGASNIYVLNGGWRHWVDNDYPTETELTKTARGGFEVQQQANLRVTTEDVKDRSSDSVLIDSRGPIGFSGDPSDPMSGHVPGAINLPYSWLLDEQTGLFKTPQELVDIMDETVPQWRQSLLISSCGSGYAGTVLLLALEMLGIKAPLYDGSFSEWKSSGKLPIKQGAS